MNLQKRVQEIQNLVLSYHPLVVMETVEEERIEALLKAVTDDMQLPLFEWTVVQGLVRATGEAPWKTEYAPPSAQKGVAFDKTTEPLDVLKHILGVTPKGIFWLKDFAKHLEDPVVVRQLREVVQLFARKRSTLVLSGDDVNLPPEIAHDAVFYDLKLPGLDELHQVVMEVVRSLKGKNRIEVHIEESELRQLVQALSGMTLNQARQVIAYAALEDGKLTAKDINRVLERKAQVIRERGLLEYVPVDDSILELGGFAGLKKWLARSRLGFSPQAQEWNLKPPKGVVIVGIQGCGKSLAAKAIAHEWKMPLLKLDAGRLYDKYVGESEKNFRQAIQLAESMSPTVLWIDEIEKSLGANNGGDTDGGLSKRLLGSFLTWMQEKSQEVFVVATANDLSQLPPELLRKGRFDEIFFVDLPDVQERGAIFRIHLKQRRQSPQNLDMPALIAATEGFSGAEIEQAVIAALYRALSLSKPLDSALMLEEIKSVIPLSVSRREDLEYLRTFAKERFVSAK